jgi:hypothetical protein
VTEDERVAEGYPGIYAEAYEHAPRALGCARITTDFSIYLHDKLAINSIKQPQRFQKT